MNYTNIIKKIVLIMIVFLSALVLSETTSKAARIPFGTHSVIVDLNGLDWNSDNYDLILGAPGEKTYCIVHGQQIMNNGTKYYVRNYVHIEGKKSSFYGNRDNVFQSNYNDSAHLLAEHTNDENLMFSWMVNHSDPGSIMCSGATEEAAEKYLSNYDPNSSLWLHVAGGGKKYSVNQQAVYGYFPTWAAANDYTIVTSGGRNQLS